MQIKRPRTNIHKRSGVVYLFRFLIDYDVINYEGINCPPLLQKAKNKNKFLHRLHTFA